MNRRIIVFELLFLCLVCVPVVSAMDLNMDLFQEKTKLGWDSKDFGKAADSAQKRGDYQMAIDYYKIAVNQNYEATMDAVPSPAILDDNAIYEKNIAECYRKIGGHEAQAAEADLRSADYARRAQHSRDVNAKTKMLCLIATATFNSPMAPQVQLLRDFRDNTVYSTRSGTQFMGAFNVWYYSFSPYVAKYIDANPWTKPPMRLILTPLIAIMTLASMAFSALSFNPEMGVVVSGLIASSLIGLFYGTPVILFIMFVARRYHWNIVNATLVKAYLALSGIGLAGIVTGNLLNAVTLMLIGSVVFILGVMLFTSVSATLLIDQWISRRSEMAMKPV